jgi:hypothetical protein
MKITSSGQLSPIGRSQDAGHQLSGGNVSATFVLRSDDNGDGMINVGDIVCEVSYLYRGGPPPYNL